MEYITHYYRFTDVAELEALPPVEGAAVDAVGIIEGATGYHVNTRWKDNIEPAEWAAYRIDAPNNPVRVFMS